MSRASENSGRAKIGARAKKGKERGGVGEGVAASFPFLFSPQFSRDENLHSHVTQHFARLGTLATQANIGLL